MVASTIVRRSSKSPDARILTPSGRIMTVQERLDGLVERLGNIPSDVDRADLCIDKITVALALRWAYNTGDVEAVQRMREAYIAGLSKRHPDVSAEEIGAEVDEYFMHKATNWHNQVRHSSADDGEIMPYSEVPQFYMAATGYKPEQEDVNFTYRQWKQRDRSEPWAFSPIK